MDDKKYLTLLTFGIVLLFGGIVLLPVGIIYINVSCNPDFPCDRIQKVTMKDFAFNSYLGFYYYPTYRFELEDNFDGNTLCYLSDTNTKLAKQDSPFKPAYQIGEEYRMYLDGYSLLECDPNLKKTYKQWINSVILIIVGGVSTIVGFILLLIMKLKDKN